MAASPAPPEGTVKGDIDIGLLNNLITLQETQQLWPAQLPLPLNVPNRRALNDLNQAVRDVNQAAKAALQAAEALKRATPISNPEPELGDKNWVSLLQQYRNANATEVGTCVEYEEEVVGDSSSSSPKWVLTTKLLEAGDLSFPREPFPFSKKKDAKKFAARHAVEWLMENNKMPDDGENVVFKKPKLVQIPPASAPSVAPNPKSTAFTSHGPSSPPSRAGAAGSTNGGGSTNDDDYTEGEDPDRAQEQLDKLCAELGFPQPKITVTLNENSKNVFSAHLNWGDETRVDEDAVSPVFNVYGRKHAKQRLALNIVMYLRTVKEERVKQNKEVMKKLESSRSAPETPEPPPIGQQAAGTPDSTPITTPTPTPSSASTSTSASWGKRFGLASLGTSR